MRPAPTATPETAEASGGTVPAAIAFARHLRDAGLEADVGAVVDFARALTLVDLDQTDDVRGAGSALFVRRPEHLGVYHAVFDRFWLGGRRGPLPEPTQGGADAPANGGQRRSGEDSGEGASQGEERRTGYEAAEDAGDGAHDQPEGRLAYSAAEALRQKSFEEMTPAELRDAARLVDHLRPRLQRRRTRRYRLHRRGTLYAPRAMLRRSLATGGDLLIWLWRRRTTRPRPLVAICDVSGSMEQHSRFALRFVHALTRVDVRTESFVFGTRLTRITPQLRRRYPDEALREVADTVRDWAGGTQIGRALHVFNRRWSRRVLRSSAIVIIVSDGWDRGEPALVAAEMEMLRRRCHRIIWLNPLAATRGYEPRTAGMAAAMPYIDDFLPAGSLETLERLGQVLARAATGPPPMRYRVHASP